MDSRGKRDLYAPPKARSSPGIMVGRTKGIPLVTGELVHVLPRNNQKSMGSANHGVTTLSGASASLPVPLPPNQRYIHCNLLLLYVVRPC